MSEHTITELLSPAFLSRMQNMLGDEYESFLKVMKHRVLTGFV